jgi:hypothetical protein
LAYLNRGWSVVPVVRQGKRPLVEWTRFQSEHPTESEVSEWWSRWSDANVGIITGQVSGLVVVDLDGADAELAFTERCGGQTPHTPRVRTGRGRHLYFRHPGGGHSAPSAVHVLPGVDVRGDGALVVAPPSVHRNGQHYEFEVTPEECELAPLPEWLLECSEPPSAALHDGDVIGEGQRNDTLYRLARSLHAKALTREAIEAALLSENATRCEPPLPCEEVSEIAAKAVTQPHRPGFEVIPRPSELQQSPPLARKGRTLPTIMVSNRQLRDITADALDALREANSPPTLFQRGGTLVRFRETVQGSPLLERLTLASLRGALARAADWRRMASLNGTVACPPPIDVVEDTLALPEWPEMPPLDGLIEAPAFFGDGTLLVDPGYHREARLWLYRALGFDIPRVSEHPSAEETKAAVNLLLTELFGEFPFVDDASRAHALAATLLPFVRELIPGQTPLHLIDAPTPGTGKGLLADVICIPATGRAAEVMAEGQNDEEWRKRLTAILDRAPVYVLIDNIHGGLDAAPLAAVLTAGVWTDRVLGKTQMVTLPVRGVWLATGNNVKLSTEVTRRTVWIRLDARVEAPWTRAGFRHPDLRAWARANRGRLVHACLTLGQAWIAEGRPSGIASLGSYEGWAATMGGILTVAGVSGFLSNAGALLAQANEETQPWRAFVLTWWDKYDEKTIGIETLYDLAVDEELLLEVLGDGGDRSQRTRLGKALGKRREQVIAGFRVASAGDDHRGRRLYRLEPAEGAPTSPTSWTNVGDHVGRGKGGQIIE